MINNRMVNQLEDISWLLGVKSFCLTCGQTLRVLIKVLGKKNPLPVLKQSNYTSDPTWLTLLVSKKYDMANSNNNTKNCFRELYCHSLKNQEVLTSESWKLVCLTGVAELFRIGCAMYKLSPMSCVSKILISLLVAKILDAQKCTLAQMYNLVQGFGRPCVSNEETSIFYHKDLSIHLPSSMCSNFLHST